MKEKEYKVKLSGPEHEYTTEITRELAAHIIGLCMRDAKEISDMPIAPSRMESNLSQPDPKESIAEYVHARGPKRNPDKILAIAGYLVKSGDNRFSPEDIKAFFPKIGEPVPANFGRDFRWAIANGWIAESPEDLNAFYVTNTGNSVISSNFNPEIISRTKQKSRLKSAKKIKNNPNGK